MSRGIPGVLVTGGAGFIGSHTVDGLLAEDYRVRVLDNLSTGCRANLPSEHSGLEFVEGDVRDAATLETAMDGITHCLHLAAQVSVERSVADPRGSSENNVLGAVNVFQAARDAGLSKVVYASSAAVYGDLDQLPLTEDAALRPSSPYGLEKRINEQYAVLFRSLLGLPMMELRYFNVYGSQYLGAVFYGYGYALSLILVSMVGLVLLDREFARLTYQTFMLQPNRPPEGFLTFDRQPRAIKPERGYLASWNNRPTFQQVVEFIDRR